MNEHDDDEWDDKKDLTRLEDLSEFLHLDDPEVEEKLKQASEWDQPNQSNQTEDSTDSLDDGQDENEPFDNEEESDFSSSSEDLMNLGDLEESDEFSDPFSEASAESLENDEDESSFGNDDFGPSDFEEDSPFGGDDSSFGEEDSFSSSQFDDNENDNEADFQNTEMPPLPEDSDFDQEDDSPFSEPTEPNFPLPQEFENQNSEDSDNSSENLEEEETSHEDPFSTPLSDDQDELDNEYDHSFTNDDEDLESDTDSDTETDQAADFQQDIEDNHGSNEEPQNEYQEDYKAEDQTTPLPVQNHSSSPSREDFQELRDFGNAITYGLVKTGGNPPHTLILRNIKYTEDAEDILILLREHGLVNDENESITEQGLQNGHLLISQISEYSAIYLAHKLRRFDVQIRLGLSEQLHPTKSYTHDNKGLVSKYNLKQDRKEALELQKAVVDIEDIIVSSTNSLEGYEIIEYIKVVSAHYMISEYELQKLHQNSKQRDPNEPKQERYAFQSQLAGENLEDISETDHENDDAFLAQYNLGLEDIYSELADDLRNQAFKHEANALIGLNYSIAPVMLAQSQTDKGEIHYKITCTGNAVWISDRA